MTSYTDPAYQGYPHFASVLVYADRMGVEERNLVESQVVQGLSTQGVRAFRSIDYAPPTRGHFFDQLREATLKTGAESLLIVGLIDRYSEEYYRPPTYHPGTTTATINQNSDYTYVDIYQSPGYVTGGYTVSKPRAVYLAALYDSAPGRQLAWRADGTASGGSSVSYDQLAVSASNEIVRLLIADRQFVTGTE